MAHEFQEHVHDREQPGVHEIYNQLRKILDKYGQDGQPRAMFAEVHVSGGWKAWCKYYGETAPEFHFPFNNGFINIEWKAHKVRELIDEIEAALPSDAWPNAHTGNFDEWRVVTRFGQAGARAAAMLLLTMRGTPLLYYGEEIGMTNVPIAPEFEQDPFGKRVELSRDPQRTPMQWDSSPHAGFSGHLTPKLWLPISSNYRKVNVETELEDPQSILNLYRILIAYRKGSRALTLGSYAPLENTPEDCYVFLRELPGEAALVALNFSQEPRTVNLTNCGRGEVAISTYLDREGEADLEHLDLRGEEGVIISLKKGAPTST